MIWGDEPPHQEFEFGKEAVERGVNVLRGKVEILELLPDPAASQSPTRTSGPSDLDRVLALCRRFHRAAVVLRKRRGDRPPLTMEDEYDVQYLLHALLINSFEDVRPEEWTPSYAGRSARMDFLLHAEQIVVEAKRTRAGLGQGEVGEQLLVDIQKYAQHPRCKRLICLVYDPENHISNPAALERDLQRDEPLQVRVVLVPQ